MEDQSNLDQTDRNRTPPSSQQMRDVEERDLDLRELNNGFASLGIDHRNNNNNNNNQGFSAGIESAYSALNIQGNEANNQFSIQSGLNSEVSHHKPYKF